MSQADSADERKTPVKVMGGGGSKNTSIKNPFPVSDTVQHTLSRVSFATARILNTEDIYDLFNINKQGACGHYAVFKKKGIELKLLPFVADISGRAHEILYQDSYKSITNQDERKQICSDLADTMIRLAATVVACLASVQIYSPSGKASFDEVPVPKPSMRGGGLEEVKSWLESNGYISHVVESREVFQITGSSVIMQFTTNVKYSAMANITLQNRSLRIAFLNPISYKGRECIPFAIKDKMGSTPREVHGPITCGILYENQYIPFDKLKRPSSFVSLCNSVLTSRSYPLESPRVGAIFEQLRAYRDNPVASEEILKGLKLGTSSLQDLERARLGLATDLNRGYYPEDRYAAARYGLDLPGRYAALPDRYGALPGRYAAALPDRYGVGFGRDGLKQMLGARDNFVNPIAQEALLRFFNTCRQLVPTEQSPAATRALTLVLGVDGERDVKTGICNDPYWKKARLSEVYPWATLQFLFISNWNKAGSDTVEYEPGWSDGFITKLREIYNDKQLPMIRELGGRSKRLEDLQFTRDFALCTPGKEIRSFGFKLIQDKIGALHKLYENHVITMMEIINSLIIEISDPDTKVKLIRLHPNVNAGTSSREYVKAQAKKAREAISAFYINVESIYVSIIKSIMVAKGQ